MDVPADKKFALLVGLNYTGTSSALRGCENDVEHIREYLITKRGYRDENIAILTEDTKVKGTGMNIMHALGALVIKAHVADAEELFFHYSGHGSYTRDYDGDEKDGNDETIIPLDYKSSGMITDDQLHDYVEYLPKKCNMYCLFDCCHSGTILDLKWRYEGDFKNYVENAASKVDSNVVMISGCRDDQTSADAYINGKWAGAMTSAFLACIDRANTWEQLLVDMRAYLRNNNYTQYPRLCSSNYMCDTDVIPK